MSDNSYKTDGTIDCFPSRFPGRDYVIEFTAPEFTSMCPMAGLPDFGAITVSYSPNERCIELRSFKYYLHTFRDRGIFYEDVVEAVRIANDMVYGLATYVQSVNSEHARQVASRMRAGQVSLNYPDWDTFAPFGGYKQSGNGREYADWAIHDFLEVKGIIGYGA